MTNTYVLDLETRLIDKTTFAPKPIVLSVYCPDTGGHFLTKEIAETIEMMLREGHTMVWHNAKFDMTVLYKHFAGLRPLIFEAYKRGSIRCTKIREALLHLSVVGHLNNPKSLAACVMRYFQEDISDAKTDPNAWRLRYSELEDVEIVDWPQAAIDYALDDTKWGWKVYARQAELANPEGECSMGTENLQTFFDFVGGLMTEKGFLIDTQLVLDTQAELEEKGKEPLAALVDAGFATVAAKGKKAGKVSIGEKKLRAYILELYPESVQYSEPSKSFPNGQVSLAADAIADYPKDPVIDALKEYQGYRKMLSTYLPNLLRDKTIHPQFNVLVTSGRTSSHGVKPKDRGERLPSENVQNLPRGGNIREAHIARPGKVLVGIDYGHLELDCLAQVTFEMFGFSRMMDAINAGKDPHCVMGAQLMSLKKHEDISYDEFMAAMKGGDKDAKFFRQMAKAANFGFPGGLGPARMTDYAKKTYGIEDMTEDAARELRKVFLDTYPEVAKLFRWYAYQEGVDGWGYSSSGRWRARCGYCDGLNGLGLQSRSADGAKGAGLLLAEACEVGELSDCDLLAFIHDEYIIEMPNDDKLHERIDLACTLMLKGMQEVLPDVRITVEADAMERWVKAGPFVYSTSKSIEPKGVTA